MTETPTRMEPLRSTGNALLRGGAWSSVAHLLPQLYTLVISVAIARALGPTDMGRQSFIAFVSLSVVTLCSGGLSVALMRGTAAALGGGAVSSARDLIRWGWRLEVAAAIVGGLIVAAPAVVGATPSPAWVLAGVGTAISIVGSVPGAVLIGTHRWRDAAVVGLVSGALSIPVLVGVLAAGGGITGVFAVETTVALLTFLAALRLARRALRGYPDVHPVRDVRGRTQARRFALTSTLGAVVTLVIFRRSEFFFLARYSSNSEIALYSIAFAASTVLALLPDRLGGVMSSAFASLFGAGDRAAIRSGFARTRRLLVFMAMVLTAFAAALGPPAITVFYGSRYDGAHTVLLLLLLGVPFAPLWSTGAAVLAGVGNARRPLAIGAIAAVVNVALAFVLIPRLDAVGAALANVGAQVSSALIMSFASRSAGGRVPWGPVPIMRAALTATGAGVAAWAATGPGGVAGLILGAVAGVAGLLVFALILRPLSHSDGDWLAKAIEGRLRGRAAGLVTAISQRNPAPRLPRHLAVFSDAPTLGGAELSLGNLLAHLDPSIRVTVVGTDPAVVSTIAARRPGAGQMVVEDVEVKYQLRRMLRLVFSLRGLGADVLQVTLRTPWSCRYLLLLTPLVPHMRVIAIEQLPTPAPDRRAQHIKRFTSGRLDAHVSVGAAAARAVEAAAGLKDGTVGVIYNGVEATAPAQPKVDGVRRIGTVARLVPQKGIGDLLRALALLPGVQLDILGDGEDRADLEALARELGVADRVTFAGWQDPRVYAPRWDAFVLASHYEGFPLSIVEALFLERTVVATDVGSVREVIHDGRTGLLVAPHDPGALADAVRCVLADPALRDRLARSGRALAESRFTAARMARAYESMYTDVLAR